MITLRFEGYSDDTFGEYAHFNDDYDNCANGDPVEFGLWSPSSDGPGLYIVGQFCPGESSSWVIGVGCYDPEDKAEDGELPDWPLRFEVNTYRNRLIVEAPDDCKLVCLTREANKRGES